MRINKSTKKAPPADGAETKNGLSYKNSLIGSDQSGNLFLSAALEYASRFWAVFPLVPKKKFPLISKKRGGRGHRDATIDNEQIIQWWSKYPGANIGLACGKRSGLIVLDIDPRHGGNDSLFKLQLEHDDLPETYTVSTSDGGRHFYFKFPNFKDDETSVSSADLADGVEVKAEGSYVMTAPSIHPNGHVYKVVCDKSPASCPKWIIDLLWSKKSKKKGKGPLPMRIKAGEQHDWLVSQAGRLRQTGLDEEEIFEALLAINEKRCDPPKEVEAIEKIAKSAGEWQPGRKVNIENHKLKDVSLVKRDNPRGEGEAVPTVYPRTDLGNSARFTDQHRDKIRFCPSVGWLIWNGILWQPDNLRKVEQLGRETTKAMYDELSSLPEEAVKEAYKWMRQSQNRPRFQAMIDLARSEHGIPIATNELDQESYLLPVKNGWVNLRTGKLEEPRKEVILTLGSDVEFDPYAQCPRWEKFINEVAGGNQELANYLKIACGYAAVGNPKERAIFLILGPGRNGKSVFLEIISKVLGTLACKTPFETLLVRQGTQIPADIARLRAKRLVYAGEAPRERAFNAALVKELSGRETLTARHLYKEFFEFTPRFVLFLGTNHLPRVDSSDEAMWDRLRVIPFNQRFIGKNENKNLLSELWEERQGILNWIVQGAVGWNQQGLPHCQVVDEEALKYRKGEDSVERFFEACVIFSPESEVETTRLFETFKSWCTEQGVRTASRKEFDGKILARNGVEKGRNTPGRMIYRGLELA